MNLLEFTTIDNEECLEVVCNLHVMTESQAADLFQIQF